MRVRYTALMILCLAESQFAEAADRSLFFLADDDGRWCGYGNELQWNAEKASLPARLVARVDYENDKPAFVYMTELDETGDWTVYDKYSLDRDQMLTSLERTIQVIPGDTSEEQRWVIQKGKATKQKSVTRSLTTKKIINGGDAWRPDIAVIANAQVFPFWPLIRGKGPEVFPKVKVCVAENTITH